MQRLSALKVAPSSRVRISLRAVPTALSIGATLLAVRLGLTLLGLRRTRRAMLPAAAPGVSKRWTARRIGRATYLMSRLVPFASCLTRAQAAQIVLARRGIASTLCLGVRQGRGGSLLAHAWLVAGDEIVTGHEGGDVASFRLLSQMGPARSWP